jgi:hypothetical protein
MMSAIGAPNPTPKRPAKIIAFVESPGCVVARPTTPPDRIKNPTNKGARIVFNFVLAKPYTTVLKALQIQTGWPRATSRNGSWVKREVVLSEVLAETVE